MHDLGDHRKGSDRACADARCQQKFGEVDRAALGRSMRTATSISTPNVWSVASNGEPTDSRFGCRRMNWLGARSVILSLPTWSLGYVLQMGALPLSPEAMEQAIRLDGADVAGTLRGGFRWSLFRGEIR
jgi:hypothetical protein